MDVTMPAIISEIKAPRNVQPSIFLWQRFLPSTFVPVRELRLMVIECGSSEIVERAIEHCGEAGNLSVEAVRAQVERWQARRQRDQRSGR